MPRVAGDGGLGVALLPPCAIARAINVSRPSPIHARVRASPGDAIADRLERKPQAVRDVGRGIYQRAVEIQGE